ncbi:MAG: DNA-directed RNA polymerase subunit A'' [Candidatus Micrarchaeia archaeon]
MENKKRFKENLVSPGEPVGVVAAQSIGEPGTQMIIGSFHLAGIASKMATAGLPRMIELVDARKKPASPFTYIYLENKIKNDFEKASTLARKLNEIKMSHLVKHTIENFSKSRATFLMDMQALESNEISLKSVESRINKLTKFETSSEGHKIIVNLHNKNIKLIRESVVKILNLTINGIEGAGTCTVQQDKKTNEFFIISDTGNITPFLDVEGIDVNRIYSNNIFEMYNVFGIEAARNTIANEIMTTLEQQGIDVSFRHVLLLADAMTHNGGIENVGRHGLTGKKRSVFARAAYEETIKHLINAAAFGEIDFMKGVTEDILVGKQIALGTGTVKLAIKKEDLAKIKKEK